MSTQTANLPRSPDGIGYELMNKTFDDLHKAQKTRDVFFQNYLPVYTERAEIIIHNLKNGDLIRKVRFFINWQVSQHRKIEVIGEDTLEKPAWKLDFIYKPGDIKTLQHMYYTPLGSPDLHSSWMVLAMFLDENFEPINPLFITLGHSILRNINQ